MDKKEFLRDVCPVCKEGALEILNYTADGGEGYYTAKCTNCQVVFDNLNAKIWHDAKMWRVDLSENRREFYMVNQETEETYDLQNFHDVVKLCFDMNNIVEDHSKRRLDRLLYCLEKICIEYNLDNRYIHNLTIEAEQELSKRWNNG